MAICERCGMEHEELTEVNVPGGKTEMWCEDCLDDAFECDYCHEWFSEKFNHTEVDGDESKLVCDDCRDTYYYQCDDCGGWFSCLNDTSTGSVCDDCFSEYTQCYDCGEWIPSSDVTYVECIDDYVCERCLDDYFTTCDCCGEYVRNDDAYSRNGYSYCENCYSDMSHVIRDYHDSPETVFNGGYDPDGFFRGFGIELEVDDGDDAEECATELAEFLDDDESVMYFMYDGSLNNGFEIVTQPHTMEAFRKIDWERIVKILENYGFKSNDTTTCGLHIHVSTELFGLGSAQKENIAKILYFYEKFYEEMKKVSRRKDVGDCRWAKSYKSVYGIDLSDMKDCRHLTMRNKRSLERYHAINLKNEDTVEFRLGKGTLKIETMFTWIELHLLLVKNSHKIPWNHIEDLDMWFNGAGENIIEEFKKRGAFKSYTDSLKEAR